MNKKLTLSMDEAVIEAAKEYAQKNGRSLSSILENMLRVTTGLRKPEKPKKQVFTDTPIVDKMTRILEEGRLSPEEAKKQEEEYYRRKPYMKEYINFLEEKHGPIQ